MNDRFRIAFCGPGGTGKTTLAGWLADYLSYPMITEQIRTFAGLMGISSVEEMTQKDRIVLQCAAYASQCHLEHKFANGAGRFVSDRSIYDYEEYMRFFAVDNDQGWMNAYRRLSSHAPGYTHLFLVDPWGPKPQNDPFRGLTDEWNTVESKVRNSLASIPGVIPLQSLTLDGRKREILHHLGLAEG